MNKSLPLSGKTSQTPLKLKVEKNRFVGWVVRSPYHQIMFYMPEYETAKWFALWATGNFSREQFTVVATFIMDNFMEGPFSE